MGYVPLFGNRALKYPVICCLGRLREGGLNWFRDWLNRIKGAHLCAPTSGEMGEIVYLLRRRGRRRRRLVWNVNADLEVRVCAQAGNLV